MQEDHKMLPLERGMSQVTIALLQVLSCSQGFAKQSCNVVAPFFISFATMLPSISTSSNKMMPPLV